MRSYGGLTKRRFLLLLSSCVLIRSTRYEPTLADYIRESERIEAIRRLKLSRPTNEAKRLFVADYDWIAKNLILQRARGHCPYDYAADTGPGKSSNDFGRSRRLTPAGRDLASADLSTALFGRREHAPYS